MTPTAFVLHKLRETLQIYWELIRIIVPISILTHGLQEIGAIEAASPLLSPVMDLYSLPHELAFAWLVGMLIGMWGAVTIIFALVSPADLSIADMTIFSALLLFAHGLPIEQKIIEKAGPRFLVTTLLRIVGGMVYAGILYALFTATGWLSDPLDPVWIPMSDAAGWFAFFASLIETLIWMFVILIALAALLEALKLSGLMAWLNMALSPLFRFAGIHGDARQFTAVGMFLGISYGGGLLIREARGGAIPPRQIFLSCIFMGFAHSVIEDTLVMVALGGDFTSLFFGRLVFAVAATALIAAYLKTRSEDSFNTHLFDRQRLQPR
jgi:spore maturation protein SpmB